MSKYSNPPTTLANLTTKRGCGFILKRLSDLTIATRKGVYVGTHYQNRAINSDGTFCNGYHSMLWSFLRDEGYIEVCNGKICETTRMAFHGRTRCTAVVGNPPTYRLTSAGKALLKKISR